MTDAAILSPCTGICKLDPRTGWCLGCARSGSEIAEWRGGTAEWRDAIWTEIPQRLEKLGVSCRRLAWGTDDIRRFVARSLADQDGAWTMGVVGGVGSFLANEGKGVDVQVDGETVIARMDGSAIAIRIDDTVRAVTFDPPGTPDRRTGVVLAIKRQSVQLPVARNLTDLGVDDAALLSEDRTRLFDLGLGRVEARFCVRVAKGEALRALTDAQDTPFPDSLSRIGAALLEDTPTRVIETGLGRIEVQHPIPHPGTASPVGSHTHLLPDHLATGRAMPIAMDLPFAYHPGAIFHPRRVTAPS